MNVDILIHRATIGLKNANSKLIVAPKNGFFLLKLALLESLLGMKEMVNLIMLILLFLCSNFVSVSNCNLAKSLIIFVSINKFMIQRNPVCWMRVVEFLFYSWGMLFKCRTICSKRLILNLVRNELHALVLFLLIKHVLVDILFFENVLSGYDFRWAFYLL